MRKTTLRAAAWLLCCSLAFSSCIGSFGLHRRMLAWNQAVGSDFENELVFLACNIIPVYGVCYLADILVLNSIEFWSGENPTNNVGEVRTLKGENGTYAVTASENGYQVTKEADGTQIDLVYNEDSRTWSAVSGGVSTEVMQIAADGTPTLLVGQAATAK